VIEASLGQRFGQQSKYFVVQRKSAEPPSQTAAAAVERISSECRRAEGHTTASDREKLEGAMLEQLADYMQDGPQIDRPYHASAAELERRQSDLAAKGEAGHRRRRE
jgi:hypothetical protein